MNTSSDSFAAVIPLYNKGETIERALRSVILQSAPPSEVIVINDGSSDNGPDVVRTFMCKYPSIRLVEQPNLGVSAARNRGAAEATSSIICFLDADDEWTEDHLANMQQLASSHPQADFYTSRHIVVLPTGEAHRQKVALPAGYCGVVNDFLDVYRQGYGIMQSSTACIRKGFLQSLGGFPPGQQRGEDLYLWLLAALSGTIAYKDNIGAKIFRTRHAGRIARNAQPFFHIAYFVPRLRDMPVHQRKPLRRFLVKNIWTHWAAAKMAMDRQTPKHLLEMSRYLSTVMWLVLFTANLLVPRRLLSWQLGVRRGRNLLNNTRRGMQ